MFPDFPLFSFAPSIALSSSLTHCFNLLPSPYLAFHFHLALIPFTHHRTLSNSTTLLHFPFLLLKLPQNHSNTHTHTSKTIMMPKSSHKRLIVRQQLCRIILYTNWTTEYNIATMYCSYCFLQRVFVELVISQVCL